MNNKSTWAGPRLLIPIAVDALVVTRKDNATAFSVQSLNIKEYEKFGKINPQPVGSLDFKPKVGVHLNWALPDGMTKGIVDKNGRVNYPYVPNRWLVTRFCAADETLREAWVVESDFLSTTPVNKDPETPYLNSEAKVRYIGKWENLKNWKETRSEEQPFLSAITNSDPLFSVYAGNNSYVFSFIDPLADNNKLNLSYMVTGWYSNEKYDILYNKLEGGGWKGEQGWIETMNRLQWSVGGQRAGDHQDLDNAIAAGKKWLADNHITPSTDDEGTYCAQTLCHGLVFDVVWPGILVEPPSNVPKYDPEAKTVSYISAANAATDCLSAFMQWKLNYNKQTTDKPDKDDRQVEILLEAFSHSMLQQPGGVFDTPELMNAIREDWFGRMPGGIIWVAQAPLKEGELKPTDNGSSSLAPLPPNLAAELAALNILQRKYDAGSRKMLTLQKQLYADWLKLNIFKKSISGEENLGITLKTLQDALDTSFTAVTGLQSQLPKDKNIIDTTAEALTAKLKTAGKFILSDEPANDFHKPGDPVVLVNNAGRSFRHGEDTVYSEYSDFLFVRFSGQFISSIEVKPKEGAPVLITADKICLPLEGADGLPIEIPALLAEAYMLDTNYASVIAKKANMPDTEVDKIKKQQTLIWNTEIDTAVDKRTTEEISGFNPEDKLFHVPSKVAVWKWVQPWSPLYLEWQVGYVMETDPLLKKWDFDGVDYNWAGGAIPEPGVSDPRFSGRSLLTPKEAVTLQARLRDFINDFHGNIPPDFVPLKDVLTGIGTWDVLSQTLTGFSQQFLNWDIEQFGYTPQDSYAEAVGDAAQGMVVVKSAKAFYPVRAGFIHIRKLRVVDDFGQVYNLTPGNDGSSMAPFRPVPGIGTRPGTYKLNSKLPPYFQLPPRVVQGARLNFNFVSAINDGVISGQSVDSGPVAGWVLPNHLNKSVMVYNNEGVFLGEVMLMGATGSPHAQWMPAPFDGCAADKISNLHLKGFVNGLLHSADSGNALKNFLTVVDETLWSVDPMGERNNQSLSILVGRPIAVVRAAVNLELYGEPSQNLSWDETGKKNTGGIENYQFPVQIGNIELNQDGVMGYFAHDDYSQFNSVHKGIVKAPSNPPYVVNTYTQLKPNADAVYITLLLDPRGDIHTSSGILPIVKTTLPELYIGKVLDDMLIEFKTGPLLVDKKQWWLPLPAGVGQKWSWLQPQQVGDEVSWEEITDLVSAKPFAQLSDSPHTIVEGRLKLTGVLGDQLMILFFEVLGGKPASEIPEGTTVKLTWASQGAETAQLTIGNRSPEVVDLNETGFTYVVTKKQEVKLTIKGKDKGQGKPRETKELVLKFQ